MLHADFLIGLSTHFILPQFDGPQTTARKDIMLARLFISLRQDSSLWSLATSARTQYFLFPQNTVNDISSLFIKLHKAISISNQNISGRVEWSAQFNLKRTEIHIENCIAARVWKLHRSIEELSEHIYEQIWRYDDTVGAWNITIYWVIKRVGGAAEVAKVVNDNKAAQR